MIRLGDAAASRDNNLNLLRMIAAILVLVSHAWPIALGPYAIEPMQDWSGKSLGWFAVLVFFGISGFLICGSWCQHPDPVRFIDRRVRRLFPGLIASLVLVALVIGPLITALPPGKYLTDPATWIFVVQNSFLLPLVPHLPGVFESNPVTAIAGSIWSLPYEAACYAAILGAGWLGLLRGGSAARGLLTLCAAAQIALIVAAQAVELHPRLALLAELSQAFMAGSVMWFLRGRLWLDLRIAAGSVCIAAACVSTPLFEPLSAISLTYAALVLAYVPAGYIRRYNAVGDYSYGVYIYAFPVQGFAIHFAGSMNPWQNIALSLPPTILLAILSWHLIEKPCLNAGRSNNLVHAK
ncbi:MAG: acyltransferase [Pseudomonadota bacterium]